MQYFKITILSFFLSLGLNTFAQESNDFEISKNLDVYTSLIQQLNLHYVDKLEPGDLTKSAIDAMLKQIDPYTVYYPESQIEDVRFMQTGQYGGIGSFLHIKNGDVVVGMPYLGFPFYKAGIRAGDIIVSIDGELVHGKSMDDISYRLKGIAGTELSLTYISANDNTEKTVNLKRELIEVTDVPYFGLVDDGVAYVKLVGFKQNAAKEVKAALDSLSKSDSLSSLILDLRDNGGGLLIQAVNIMNLFVDAGETIVSTKGKTKSENFSYATTQKAPYNHIKVVVLMNKNSASASEIVAGAFQDLDRGVIMGQKSYGKGLVQKVFQLSYRSQAKITVAKYYIPSGRCIQSLDYQHKDASGKANRIPDSLMATFKTKSGRLVHDAGGIIPDVKLSEKKYPEIAEELLAQYKIFDYATEYVYSNDSIQSISNFVLNDKVYNDFIEQLKKDSFSYYSDVDKQINILEKIAELNSQDLEEEIKLLRLKMANDKEKEFALHNEVIKSLIRQELVSRYFFYSGMVEAQLTDDLEVKEAIQLLHHKDQYGSILQGN